MAALDDVMTLIREHVGGGASEISMERAAIRSARRLCQEARCLRRPIVMPLVIGVVRYSLEPNWPTNTTAETAERDSLEVIGVRAVDADGSPLSPDQPEAVQPSNATGSGRYVVYEPNEIDVYPFADARTSDTGLTVQAVLRPKFDATVLPRTLGTLYAEQIAWGACAQLYAMPDQVFTSDSRAGEYEQRFRDAIVYARLRADKQGRPRQFFTVPHW